MITDASLTVKMCMLGTTMRIKELHVIDCLECTDDLYLPFGLVGLCDGCLSGLDNLKLVKLASSITEVGEGVFSNCLNLEKIIIYEHQRQFEDRLKYANTAEVIYVHQG